MRVLRFVVLFSFITVAVSWCGAQIADIDLLMAKAQAGDVSAELGLAKAYEFGKGVKADRFEAADWYLKAAQAGNAEAQNITGVMLRRATGDVKIPRKRLNGFARRQNKGTQTRCLTWRPPITTVTG